MQSGLHRNNKSGEDIPPNSEALTPFTSGLSGCWLSTALTCHVSLWGSCFCRSPGLSPAARPRLKPFLKLTGRRTLKWAFIKHKTRHLSAKTHLSSQETPTLSWRSLGFPGYRRYRCRCQYSRVPEHTYSFKNYHTSNTVREGGEECEVVLQQLISAARFYHLSHYFSLCFLTPRQRRSPQMQIEAIFHHDWELDV